MTQAQLWAVYLVDTCCLMRLDGADDQPTKRPYYTALERGLIWQGLEELSQRGALILIRHVRDELDWNRPTVLARLLPMPGMKVLPTRNIVREGVKALVAKYPKLARDRKRERADVWLIAAAKQYGYTVLTDEISTKLRKSRPRHPPIPDICAKEDVDTIDLRKLAEEQGWL